MFIRGESAADDTMSQNRSSNLVGQHEQYLLQNINTRSSWPTILSYESFSGKVGIVLLLVVPENTSN